MAIINNPITNPSTRHQLFLFIESFLLLLISPRYPRDHVHLLLSHLNKTILEPGSQHPSFRPTLVVYRIPLRNRSNSLDTALHNDASLPFRDYPPCFSSEITKDSV
ncbi:MAG TPA: hypothetical protein DCE18_11870 [Syntrophobacteraceae bacterium]|nr:hypothetical protein [Syntrophobacteraceae bacterium]HBZ56738.1 hypothetical protein [Syntrophobacteraceae bacterium]